jgi:hypothetical protein
MYRVLKPVYTKTGETTQTPDGVTRWERAEMVEIGTAESMADAYAKYPRGYWNGYSHVLEQIK